MDLKLILEKHGKWLRGESDGERANLSWADLSGAKTEKKYISISCIGSRRGMTTYCYEDDRLWCGCWAGTLVEFEARVKDTYPDETNIYRKEYDAAIEFFERLKK